MSDQAINQENGRIARLLLAQDVAEFLYREAEILDERRYEEWLALLADDIRYWMPMRRNVKFGEGEREFTRAGTDIAWFDEGKDTLRRVADDWQIAGRTIILDQNVLLSKNLTFFF